MIKHITAADLPIVLDIYNYAIEHTTALYEYDKKDIAFMQQWFTDKQQQGFPVIGSYNEEQQLQGFASYGVFRSKPAYKPTVEHSVYVHPNFMRQGIGRKLLTAIINEARSNGYHCMIAGIDGSNEVSIQLHQQFGFTHCGRIKECAYKFDRWLDLVFMQLLLNNQDSI